MGSARLQWPLRRSLLNDMRVSTLPLVFLPLAFSLFTGCGKQEGDSGSSGGPVSGPVEVTVYSVATRPFVDSILAVGTLRADESIEVSTNVTERIEEILFDDGQQVEKGETLALLSTLQEEAMLDSARAALAEAEREVDRLLPLVKSGASADIALAERKTEKIIAEAKIAQMKADVSDRRIIAPFSGTVGLRMISPGALVEPGTVITTLDKTDRMKLDFTVPETFLDNLKPGLEIEGTSSAFPDEPFTGNISTVDSRVDPVTRSVAIRALIPNPEGRLRPGMLMTVNLERNPRTSLVVPERCIVPIRSDQFVFKIVDGKAIRTEVTTGSRVPGFVEIVEGLSENDLIVSDGILSLQDGSEVSEAGRFEKPVEPFDPTNGQES